MVCQAYSQSPSSLFGFQEMIATNTTNGIESTLLHTSPGTISLDHELVDYFPSFKVDKHAPYTYTSVDWLLGCFLKFFLASIQAKTPSNA
ncbi:hypothetical protein CEXT_290361 [Caerostris extrusa]|uniref:Uncharacterized protein n=1 Tax=Caerostris extrusa TaxID=172846 RepID=A0AAV4SYW8_CAEEX|nr:hypothetical protein CEXT_290361 [Caerostris extrusa]